MKSLVLVVVAVLAACSANPAPVAKESPTSPPLSVTPSTTRDASPGPVLVLSCRLPVTWAVQNGQTLTRKAGFVTFPDHAAVEDPSAPPGSIFYDRGPAKWLPTWRESVSPDGRQYAYSEGNSYQGTGGKLHVVDVASGTDRMIYSGGAVYSVVDFNADGIYVTGAVPEGRPRGLWLFNPAGGPSHLISSTIVAPAVGGGAAWGVDFNPADPSPGPGGMEGPMNRILRIDLRSGASAEWLYRPGADLWLMGVDGSGHPLVRAQIAAAPTDPSGRDTIEVWLVTSNATATRLFAGAGEPTPARLAAVDSHGVWFDSSSGPTGSVWLYAGGAMQMVATVPVSYFSVAGGCMP